MKPWISMTCHKNKQRVHFRQKFSQPRPVENQLKIIYGHFKEITGLFCNVDPLKRLHYHCTYIKMEEKRAAHFYRFTGRSWNERLNNLEIHRKGKIMTVHSYTQVVRRLKESSGSGFFSKPVIIYTQEQGFFFFRK